MPRLLDTRLIGFDIGDVQNKTYSGSNAGWVLQVAGNGQSMLLGPAPASSNAVNSLVARDTERGREGLTFQQTLATYWVNITPTSGTPFVQVTGIAYGRGRFVAVGFGAGNVPVMKWSSVSSNTAPVVWVDVDLSGLFNITAPTDPIWGVRFLNDSFIAFGQNGKLAISVDGVAWTPVVLPAPAGHIYSVAYGPGVGYLAVGQTNNNNTLGPGIAWFSIDALNWTRVLPSPLGSGLVRPDVVSSDPSFSTLVAGDIPIYNALWGKDKFVAVGGEVYSAGYPHQDTGPNVKHIAWSTVGNASWTQVNSALPASAHYTVEYGNGRYCVGTNESQDGSIPAAGSTIIYSNDGISWSQAAMFPSVSPGVRQTNVQSITYGNGIFVAASNSVYISVDGLAFNQVTIPSSWPGSAPGAIGTPAAYGNGLFVIGSRGGQIIRSAFGGEVFGAGSGGGGGGGGGAEYVWAIPWDPTLTTGSYVINPGDTVGGSNLYRFSGDPFTPIGGGTTSTPINEGTWRNVGDRAYSLVSANPTGLQLPPIYQGGLFIRVS